VHAKSDAEVIAVRPALEHANVTLLTNSEAVALNTDAGGETVTEVVVERDGERETYSADIVAVSCGAANSAKLLLASATDKHPNGLANGSDQVGRNYMFHNSQAVLALSKEPNPTVFQKTLGLNDFYFAGEEFDHPLGNIQMVGKSQAPMFRGEKPIETKLAPSWSLEKIAAHAVDFWLSTEDLPKRSTNGMPSEVRPSPARGRHSRVGVRITSTTRPTAPKHWDKTDAEVMAQAAAIPLVWGDQANMGSDNVAGVINLFNANCVLPYTSPSG
jgi:choline dehydrogenase-like flavoprotein